jgi:hypothetical protein
MIVIPLKIKRTFNNGTENCLWHNLTKELNDRYGKDVFRESDYRFLSVSFDAKYFYYYVQDLR